MQFGARGDVSRPPELNRDINLAPTWLLVTDTPNLTPASWDGKDLKYERTIVLITHAQLVINSMSCQLG